MRDWQPSSRNARRTGNGDRVSFDERSAQVPTSNFARCCHGKRIHEFNFSWILVCRQVVFDEILNLTAQFSGGCEALGKLHKGFHDLASQLVRCRHNGRQCNRRVFNETLFNLSWANAIAGTDDHIVFAALEPESPVLILDTQVTAARPVAFEFRLCRRGVVPVLQKEHWIVAALEGDLSH